jgi:hypothetical protein
VVTAEAGDDYIKLDRQQMMLQDAKRLRQRWLRRAVSASTLQSQLSKVSGACGVTAERRTLTHSPGCRASTHPATCYGRQELLSHADAAGLTQMFGRAIWENHAIAIQTSTQCGS